MRFERKTGFATFEVVHKIVVCMSKVCIMAPPKHFLHLFMIYFVQSSKSILLEAKASRPFEMLHSIILKRILLLGSRLRKRPNRWSLSASPVDFSLHLPQQFWVLTLLTFHLKKSLEFCQLPLETHFWEDYWSFFRCELECLFESHVFFLH